MDKDTSNQPQKKSNYLSLSCWGLCRYVVHTHRHMQTRVMKVSQISVVMLSDYIMYTLYTGEHVAIKRRKEW